MQGPYDQPQWVVALPPVPPVGARRLTAGDLTCPCSTPIRVDESGRLIEITTDQVAVAIDRDSGAIRQLLARATGTDWGRGLGRIGAFRETGNDVTLAVDDVEVEPAPTAQVQVTATGPLCARVRIVRRLLDVEWVELLTVWSDRARVDLEISVQWPGLVNWQVRLGLAADVRPSAVTYGSPFHATRWDDVPAEAGPRNRDEIDPADFRRYREIQHWLRVDDSSGAVTITTQHPGLRLADEGSLDAVLLRTPASCGDPRMFWTNAGLLTWRFGLHFGIAAGEAASELGDHCWRSPLLRTGGGDGVDGLSLLRNSGDPVVLSALMSGAGGSTSARVVNLSARTAAVCLVGPLVGAAVELVDLDDRVGQTIATPDGTARFTVEPWRIQTIRFLPPRGGCGTGGPSTDQAGDQP